MKGGFSGFNPSFTGQLPLLRLVGSLAARGSGRRLTHGGGDVTRVKLGLLSPPTGSLVSLTARQLL